MTLTQAPWLWLCVLPDLVPDYEQTRAFWNVDENRMEAIAAADDQFWLGVSDPAKDRPSKSAAGRVAALFRHGRRPNFETLALTRSLIESIWVAFAPIKTDQLPRAAPEHLLRFLRAHRGGIAFVREAAGPDTGEYDEELNRLMREQAASQPYGASVVRVTARQLGDHGPDDGGDLGVRDPRRPLPDSPPASAAIRAEEGQRN